MIADRRSQVISAHARPLALVRKSGSGTEDVTIFATLKFVVAMVVMENVAGVQSVAQKTG